MGLARTWLKIATCACALLAAQPVLADLFIDFYAPKAPQVVPELPRATQPAVTTGAQCLSAIFAAQQRHGIPDNLLLAIGIQEAGRTGPEGFAVWPWTVNAAGEGVFFKTRQEAVDWMRQKQAEGITSMDLGCMQINLRWHGGEFLTDEAMLDPAQNVDYAARFLRNLYRETGDWTKAAGRYHSGTEKHQKRYLQALKRNRDVAASQMPRLAALANSYVPEVALAEVDLPLDPEVPPVFWAVDAQSGANYSIYSTQPLQPVLPAYRDSF